MLDLRAVHSAVKREDWPTAWHLSSIALNEDPDRPEALYLAGCCLRAMGNIGLSLVCFSRALAKEGSQPNLWMNYGAALHDLNKYAEAEQAFRHVNKFLPDDPMPIANIGATYVQRGLWHDTINWCDRALALEPTNHIAQVSKAFASLSLGRWADGWKYAEALYGNHIVIRVYNKREDEEPQWDGAKGQTVVVQCDQGVGDIIMFSQLLPRFQADCKRVIVECAERMVGYFKRNFPGLHVYGTLKQSAITWPADYGRIDARIHISLLGRFYLNRDSDFQRTAYCTPDPALFDKWNRWLAQFGKRTIGIAWRGGVQQTQTHLRSVTLNDYAPILQRDAIFVDLSYHDSAREVAEWNIANKTQIVIPPIDKSNYDDTIALIAALDEVVTVTTTVAHVCGALGRKARVLVPSIAQWRYAYQFNGGKELIWYPPNSVRLYRQTKGETEWKHAIARLDKDL
jgi:hypothetical protein